ncbi:MAG: 2-dehydro-3-deoxyphosphogluconate aldolase, partial [Treponema sp. GWC1_61_84]
PLGKALLAGGIPVAEVTFRTAAAEDAIRSMKAECPGLLVGAGTVINVELAKKAIAAGAAFIVSPGFNPATVDYCLERGVPVLPGANNPSLIEAGLEKGLDVFKFFPAEASGGVAMIDALAAPFGAIKFVPTGGIDASNVGDYARRDAVLAIGGSWMVKADLVSAKKWDEISGLCAQAVAAVNGFSFGHLGVNQADEAVARETAGILASLGLPSKEGNSSIFAGSSFEIMKTPFRGTHGHLAIKCFNVERALAFLARLGYSPVEETAKTEKGHLKTIYLDKEIGGFAVHLLRD